MSPEFTRPERIDTIGTAPRSVTIEADADERRRLAGRFGLVGIERLAATFALRREGEAIAATGRVEANVTQACSVTGEPLAARVDEAVDLRFIDEDAAGADEVELAADALDTMAIENGAVDLGEAAAETMALALDPFPRGPGAAAALASAGVIDEDQAADADKPLGGLAALKDLLKRD